MEQVTPERIRNVAVVGHGGSGKTTLVETLLHELGATSRLGRVDDGTSILDTDPEEHRRRITINVAVAQVLHDGTKITLLDTPGFADFAGDRRAALRVADAALVVVDGSAGIQVGTQQVWRDLEARRVPRVIVVSRLDRDNADFGAVLTQLRETYGSCVVPLHVPTAEPGPAATIDLLHETVLRGPREPSGEVDAAERDRVAEQRKLLVEAVVETRDDLTERYLEEAEIPYEQLRDALHAAVREGKVVPVVGVAADRRVGLGALLNTIVEMLPSPAETPAVVGTHDGAEVARRPESDERLAAFVFKTLADQFVGKLSYVRVYAGTLRHNSTIYDALRDETERVGHIFALRGKEQTPIDAAVAGDICAIPKLTASLTNSTLCDREAPLLLAPIEFPEPSFSVAIEPASKADLDKLGAALHRLTDEDPTLRVRRDDATHETILSAIGEPAIEVAVHHLKDKFGVQVETRIPRVPYRESIRGRAQAQGRYKKQTGGHGQFGDVWLSIEPLTPGTGIEFATKVVGGAVPKNYFPAVEKGVREQALKGVLAGFPLSDLRATLYDGSYHTVDSSEMSFKIAGSLALQACVREAQPYLLEPVMDVEVIVPEEQMGDVLSDLNGRRGRVLGMESAGAGHQRIRAHVPMAELFRYATELRSMTGGRGTFHAEPLGYEECPPHIAAKVIAEHEARGDREAAGAH